MANSKKKHIVLGYLKGALANDSDYESPYHGAIHTNLLHEKLKMKHQKIWDVCNALVAAGQIEEVDVNLSTLYRITNKGVVAYGDRFYLDQVWYRTQRFWFNLIPITISLIALVFAILAFYKN